MEAFSRPTNHNRHESALPLDALSGLSLISTPPLYHAVHLSCADCSGEEGKPIIQLTEYLLVPFKLSHPLTQIPRRIVLDALPANMSHDRKTRRVAVLGGGPAGLSAAFRLLTPTNRPTLPPLSVDLYESSPRFGGIVTTERNSAAIYELGPATMQAKHAGVADLIHDKLALTDRVLPRSDKATRFYLLKGGQLQPLPTSPRKFLETSLLSLRGKVRVLSELFRRKGADDRETVQSFFERRFGSEIVDYVVDPMVAGIYSSTPQDLGVRYALAKVWKMERDAGSVIKAVLTGKAKQKPDERFKDYSSKELAMGFSYDNGLDVLTTALCDGIRALNKGGKLYRKVPVRSLDRDKDGLWRVNGKGKYDAVISTIPAHSLGSIKSNVSSLGRGFRRLKRRVNYAPVSIVVLGFERSQIPHPLDGYGALVPSVEGRKILGVNFMSSNFPSHVKDPDKVFLTVYLGGMRHPDIPFLPAQDILDISTKELGHILGVKSQPFFARIRTWTQGIPQYTPQHGETLCAAARVEKRAPGMILGGNYRDGVGLPDALMSGIDSADRAMDYIQKRSLKLL